MRKGGTEYLEWNRTRHLLAIRTCPPRRHTVHREGSGPAPRTLPISPARICAHSRLISDSVTEEEQKAGMVRCVECGNVILDPRLQRIQGNVSAIPRNRKERS